MVDWTSKQIRVYERLRTKGFSITVKRITSPASGWNDTTGTYTTPEVAVTYPAYGIKTKRDLRDASGTVVQMDATVLLISAYGLPAGFSTSDEVLIGSAVQRVVRISPVDPLNVPLMYEVYLG